MALDLSRHIAITGMGVVGVFGTNAKELWQWLDDDQTNFGPSSRYYSPLPCAESVRPDMRRMFRSGQLSRAPLISQFAVAAVHMAMEQAGIDTNKGADVDSIGMVYGTSNGPGVATQKIYDDFIEKGASGVKPRVFQESVFNAPASLCSIHFKIKGPIQVLPAGANSGATVLYQAQMLLARPSIKNVIVLCSDELCEAIQSGLRALRWHIAPAGDLSARPEKGRGGIMSEGAVALVLERADAAIKRGATPLVELAGVSTTNDAFRIARPAEDGRGLALAIKQSLDDANEPAEAVDLILNGSTGTSVDDLLEDAAIEAVYGDAQPHRATSKRHIGVAGGTSVLFDVALAVEVLRRSRVPAPLAKTTNQNKNINTIMCNGIGLNGLYGAVLIRRPVW